MLLSSGTLLSFPYLAGKLLDVAVGKVTPYFSSLAHVFLYMLCVAVAQAVFSAFRVYYTGWVSEQAACDLRQRTYEQLLSLPVPFYDKQRVGDLLSRLQTDVTLMQQAFSTSFAEIIRQVSITAVGSVLIFSIAPKLSLLMLLILPLLLLLGMYFGRTLRRLSKENQTQQGQISTLAEESLHLIHTIKAFTAEHLQAKRYAKKQKQVLRVALRSIKQRSLFVSLLVLLMLGGMASLLTYGASLVKEDSLSTGDLLTFVLYTTFIAASVASLGDLYGQLQKIRGASDRLCDVFEEVNETTHIQQGSTPFQSGDLCIESLYFCYPARPEVEVLKGLDLHVPIGSWAALVGSSGAGKSTVVKLLLRCYLPQKGRIFIGEHNISSFSVRELRKQIGIVPQEPVLFGESIAENIIYGCPSATRAEIETAVEQAHLVEFIEQLPEGLETRIGEKGLRLSGGQRQQVAIARAILKNPSLLILDEATSALDSASEECVRQALQNLMRERTTLIIAHRLATIREVDRIYVLKEGRLIEAGTHDELRQQPNSFYQKLIASQTLL